MKLPDNYAYEGPFIKQITPTRIAYDQNYVDKCRTTTDMAYMRLGWLSAFVPYSELKKFQVVDIGSGAGVLARVFERACGGVKKYDLAGDSISKAELHNTAWDLVILNDVLEHYDNIDDLFLLKWRYAFLSFPETPSVESFDELKTWRHFRPDEHIYHLHEIGVREWAQGFNATVIAASNFEDILRTRWADDKPNITAMLIKRDGN
jgi:hypothetical protein